MAGEGEAESEGEEGGVRGAAAGVEKSSGESNAELPLSMFIARYGRPARSTFPKQKASRKKRLVFSAICSPLANWARPWTMKGEVRSAVKKGKTKMTDSVATSIATAWKQLQDQVREEAQKLVAEFPGNPKIVNAPVKAEEFCQLEAPQTSSDLTRYQSKATTILHSFNGIRTRLVYSKGITW